MILELDDYEATNLYHTLLFLKDLGGDTGDWYNQVLFKFPASVKIIQPNKTPHQLLAELQGRIGYNALKR